MHPAEDKMQQAGPLRPLHQTGSKASLSSRDPVSIWLRNVSFFAEALRLLTVLYSPLRVDDSSTKGLSSFEQHIMGEIKLLRTRVAELERTATQSMTGPVSKEFIYVDQQVPSGSGPVDEMGPRPDNDDIVMPWTDGRDEAPRPTRVSAGSTPGPVDTEQMEDAGEFGAYASDAAQ